MKINGIIIALITLMFLSVAFVFSGHAIALDPRAEVPGATITGVVLDASGNNIPNATVKLSIDGQLFDIPRNPQQSSGATGPYATIGRYQFMRLPYGEYLITAEIPDAAGTVHETNLSVNVNANTITADLVIPDLVIATPAILSPSPSPSATASPAPVSFLGAGAALLLIGIYAHLIANRKNK